MQWNQPQSNNNVGSGVQWNTQSPTDGPGSAWNTGSATGSGMQWGQGGSSPANSAFAGDQNNSSFASPFAGGGSTETPFSSFNRSSPESSGTFDAPNVSNSIPFTPALDPFASSEQKKRPRWGVIVGVILLLIVLVGASVGGVIYFTRGDNNAANQGNTPATTTLKPLPTPTSKPLFSDTFANNNNGWRLEKDEKGAFAVSLGKNALTLADNDNKILWEMLPNTKRYGDFQLFVNTTLTKGDANNGGGGYGVYVRSASTQSGDLSTYYRFELYGDGSYSIFKGQSDPANGKVLAPKEIVANTQHPAIQTMGKQNQLVIKAKGPNITFIVNGQTIKSISDSSYLSGSIALFVSNLPNTKPGAEAQFSNLGIYPAE
ncbi:hypothetical protein KSX_06350 [Ktedonospora formicarum]|uniref:3-keto-alpha-glucoside-1,2-lyase/3-keto-2-hydroxy-glucal hydratase domain-containing protein n=2 Tax=Ktedonospora formicarum TaxID=2778364 RepID=A0A8J3HXI3_9CHLR|nr:hypothetical protein KSX_06350 [Ktedonospora formicarum]